LNKYILVVIFVLSCFFTKTSCVIPEQLNYTLSADEIEIIALVRNSVADTKWMRASTPDELDIILGCYYTAPLVSRINNSTWEFVNKPTDWHYKIKAKNIKINRLFENKAVVYFDLTEYDPLTCNRFFYKAEYHLIKTENGWRINHILITDF
jgi:hypothetical protein